MRAFALLSCAISIVAAQQAYTITTSSVLDNLTPGNVIPNARNRLENSAQNYRGMMVGFYQSWNCYWVSQYNALADKGDASGIAMFDSWLSMQDNAATQMYNAQQELTDIANTLGEAFSNMLDMYKPTTDQLNKEVPHIQDVQNWIEYTQQNEYASFLKNSGTCNGQKVPGEVPYETYYVKFGLGRKYQADQASNSLSLVQNQLKPATETKQADATNANQNQLVLEKSGASGASPKNKAFIIPVVVIPVVAIGAIIGGLFYLKKKRASAMPASQKQPLAKV